ncbi:hypothetical protein BE221DRAFT_58793, partial [Ostreococcus tauri]
MAACPQLAPESRVFGRLSRIFPIHGRFVAEAKSFADKKSQTFDRASSLNVLSSALRASFAARLAFSIVSLRVRVALAPD